MKPKDPKDPKDNLQVINAVHACAAILQSAAYVLRMIPDETEFAPGFQEELKLCEDFLRRASIFVYATGVEEVQPDKNQVLDVAMETIEHHYDYLTSKREGVLSIKSSYRPNDSKGTSNLSGSNHKDTENHKASGSLKDSSEHKNTLSLNGSFGLFGNPPKGEA